MEEAGTAPGETNVPPAAGARGAPRATCAVDPADSAYLEGLVDEAVADLEARLGPPAGGLLGVILAGSLARGEGTVWRGAAGPRALSDLDLAAVVADEATRVRLAPLAASCARGLARRLRARGLVAAVDVGVYAPVDLARQIKRPGTLEMRRSGRVLRGPADLPELIPAFEESEIPRDEALVLLENRGLELLAAWPGVGPDGGGDAALAALYAGMKALLDAAFALVVYEGRCPATGQARQAALELLTVEGRFDDLHAVLPDFRSAVAFWTSMKSRPDATAIARHLGVADRGDLVALARRTWREGARAWVECYRVLVGRMAGRPGAPLAVLVEHAAHRARLRRRLRRWAEWSLAARSSGQAGSDGWALRPMPARLGLALHGAPEHELAATAAILLGAWAAAAGAGPPPDWPHFVRSRFPGACPERLDWERCRHAVVRLWDSVELRGTRTAWDVPPPRPAEAGQEDRGEGA